MSHRVGLAKSNVLRYFDSREAIFLELFDEEFHAWLTDLDARLGKPRARKAGYATEVRLATTMAASLVDAELLCELLASMAVVLERNISGEFARDFKARVDGRMSPRSDNSSPGNFRGYPSNSRSSSPTGR